MILPEHKANGLLAAAGIPTVALIIVGSIEEAIAEADRLGYPVVLKLSSAGHSHKTEIGGVHLGLADTRDVAEAFEKLTLLRKRLDLGARIILEPMAGKGAELFIGFQHHLQFGPVLSLGMGGVSLELYQDVTFRLLPAGMGDFEEMLSELKCWPKLQKGFRDLPPVEEGAVLGLLEKVAAFVLSRPEVRELDLNPVIFTTAGPVIVDATVVLPDETP